MNKKKLCKYLREEILYMARRLKTDTIRKKIFSILKSNNIKGCGVAISHCEYNRPYTPELNKIEYDYSSRIICIYSASLDESCEKDIIDCVRKSLPKWFGIKG